MKYIVYVVATCCGVSIFCYAAMSFYMASKGVTLGFHGKFAMALGIFFTTLLGGGLMALLFYSARSGHDDQAHDLKDTE